MNNVYKSLELSELYLVRAGVEDAIEEALKRKDKISLRYKILHFIKGNIITKFILWILRVILTIFFFLLDLLIMIVGLILKEIDQAIGDYSRKFFADVENLVIEFKHSSMLTAAVGAIVVMILK